MCIATFTETTAQVKGSAKIMVTVMATQELEAGDVLRRFGAEATQDEPHGGNNNNRYIVVGLVAVDVWKLSLHMGFFSLLCCPFSLVLVCVCVCVCVFFLFVGTGVILICTACFVMFSILYKVAALAGCCISDMKT